MQGSLLQEVGHGIPLEVIMDLVDRVQARQHAIRALREAEEALAVDLALARSADYGGARELAQVTGLTRREVGRLVREASRFAF